MSSEPAANQEETKNEQQVDAIAPELLDKIKHPPAIDDVMEQTDPEELLSNPAVAPQMLDEQRDLRDDIRQD